MTPAIELNNLSFAYPGSGHSALKDVSIRVERGERLGVLGPNGGGKSTLLKLVLGLERPTDGTIIVDGDSPEIARRRGIVGYVAQRQPEVARFPVSGREAVVMPVRARTPWYRTLPTEARAQADRALELVGASGYCDRPVGALSGGQLQRILMARSVASGARILLLDEPTTGIDVAGQRAFARMIRDLSEQLGLTVVTVSHEVRTLAATSDRVACLSRTLHYHDAPAGLTPRVLGELFHHDLEAVFDGGIVPGGDGVVACEHEHGADQTGEA